MRTALFLFALLAMFPAPAKACRCYVADTPDERAAYASRIGRNAYAVMLGEFSERGETLKFVANEVVLGPSRTRYSFPNPLLQPAGRLIYSGSCVQIAPRPGMRTVLVLRRPEDDDSIPQTPLPDGCASRFLTDHPGAIGVLRRRAAKRRHP